ncbi:MAG: hypothetical protein MUP16_02230, partial [Sedimentisphaerales bacterium]|nr:hypothetical protein [Sedimentisphaerales bacterium]
NCPIICSFIFLPFIVGLKLFFPYMKGNFYAGSTYKRQVHPSLGEGRSRSGIGQVHLTGVKIG